MAIVNITRYNLSAKIFSDSIIVNLINNPGNVTQEEFYDREINNILGTKVQWVDKIPTVLSGSAYNYSRLWVDKSTILPLKEPMVDMVNDIHQLIWQGECIENTLVNCYLPGATNISNYVVYRLMEIFREFR